MTTTLILPGLGNSGPEHWQTQWERLDPTCHRVLQDEWDAPRCEDWVRTLDAAISASADDAPVPLERLPFTSVGNAGHINSASGLGEWPAGYALLESLRSTPIEGRA